MLVEEVEKKASEQNRGVPAGYYEQLAVLYLRQGNREAEKAILERYARRRPARQSRSRKLRARLERLR
jgi:hypothetical protein